MDHVNSFLRLTIIVILYLIYSAVPSSAQPVPDIQVHYLGHSSFILIFDNGVSILTDYGVSGAYGLDSPVYEAGDFQPVITMYSHHHPDHDRGMNFTGDTVLNGNDLKMNNIDIKAVKVTENAEDDNFGYLITYKGFRIFFAGDCQGDIVNISGNKLLQKKLQSRFSEKIDLLFVPIDWVGIIYDKVPDYINFLQPRLVIPMHYWSPSVKSEFLALLKSEDRKYDIVETGNTGYDIFADAPADSLIKIISLDPGAFKK